MNKNIPKVGEVWQRISNTRYRAKIIDIIPCSCPSNPTIVYGLTILGSRGYFNDIRCITSLNDFTKNNVYVIDKMPFETIIFIYDLFSYVRDSASSLFYHGKIINKKIKMVNYER